MGQQGEHFCRNYFAKCLAILKQSSRSILACLFVSYSSNFRFIFSFSLCQFSNLYKSALGRFCGSHKRRPLGWSIKRIIVGVVWQRKKNQNWQFLPNVFVERWKHSSLFWFSTRCECLLQVWTTTTVVTFSLALAIEILVYTLRACVR